VRTVLPRTGQFRLRTLQVGLGSSQRGDGGVAGGLGGGGFMRFGIGGFLADKVFLVQIGVAVGTVFPQLGAATGFGQRGFCGAHPLRRPGGRRSPGGEAGVHVDQFHLRQ